MSANRDDSDVWEAWQIRDFPRQLRQDLVAAAKERRMTPGELAARHLYAARERGWEILTPVQPEKPRGNGLIFAELLAIASTQGLPKWLRTGVSRQIAALAGIPAPVKKPLAPVTTQPGSVTASLPLPEL